MIDIRQNLIEEELNRGFREPFNFKQLNPTSRFISWLFNHYYTQEFTEHFYDYEGYMRECVGESYDRLTINNWIEVYGNGIWEQSQKDTDRISRERLKSTKRISISYKGRLFWAKEEDCIYIYYYGRDYAYKDYWWIMKRK